MPECVYLEDAAGRRSLTFGELAGAVEAWLDLLEHEDVVPGSIVALSIADPVSFASAYLATIAGGYWVAPLDPAALSLKPETTLAAAADLGAQLVIGDLPVGCASRIRCLPVPTVPWRPAQLHPSELRLTTNGGAVLSSSGTTGAPKVIELNQSQLLFTARQVAAHHELSPEDRGFNALPLFHINAEVVGLLASLVASSTLVLQDRFHRTGFWDMAARRRITWINAVPAIVTLLADVRADETVPTGIRFIRSASAPLPAHTMLAFEASTGIPVLETYGMTEAASQITANPLHGVRKPGSVGLPVGIELRVVADDGSHSGEHPGVVGEVEIRGQSVITRYSGSQPAPGPGPDGWLRTGDLGYLDPEGYVFLVGRVDDVINRSGEKIFPREIEEILLKDASVLSAVVVGSDDAVLGQVPVAYVVLKPDEPAEDTLARLAQALSSELVRSRRPGELRIVEALPSTPTGKVRRTLLRVDAPPVLHWMVCR
jgi:acyl-CoA synthetase (AMP-forming)/AMP-acid ligase II